MRNFILLMSVLFLTACGGGESQQKNEEGTGGVIPQHQLDAMKSAEDVSNVLQQAEDERRKQADGT
jgi:hypothetical protein